MYYNDQYFASGRSPYAVTPTPQQQQQPQIGPGTALQAYQQFSGGGAAGGQGGLQGLFGGGQAATPTATQAAVPAGQAAGGTAAGGAQAAGGAGQGIGSAVMSSPIGWIAAAALAQNVAHNKGISSWQSALKGQSGAAAGEHFMEQWGVDEDSKLRDIAGLAGWGRGGGILNPSYLPTKLFGRTD